MLPSLSLCSLALHVRVTSLNPTFDTDANEHDGMYFCDELATHDKPRVNMKIHSSTLQATPAVGHSVREFTAFADQ